MSILGKRIVLRAIEAEDLPLLHEWSNDQKVAQGLGDVNFPSSFRQQEQWFERMQSDSLTVRLAIQVKGGPLIGYTGFWSIHWRDRRAEHGIVIGDRTCSGKGYGREAILTCARYAFEEMGLYRLDATVLETNQASLKTYQSCGFQMEGLLRQHAIREGKRVNRIILGLLAADYFSLVQNTDYWNRPEA